MDSHDDVPCLALAAWAGHRTGLDVHPGHVDGTARPRPRRQVARGADLADSAQATCEQPLSTRRIAASLHDRRITVDPISGLAWVCLFAHRREASTPSCNRVVQFARAWLRRGTGRLAGCAALARSRYVARRCPLPPACHHHECALTSVGQCDSLVLCSNCSAADVPCEYDVPKKRGPRPASAHHPGGNGQLPFPAPDMSAHSESPSFPTTASDRSSHVPLARSATNSTIAPSDFLPASYDTQAQLAITVHSELLAGLGFAMPSKPPAWTVDRCVLLYKQHAFGALPICQESTLRTAVDHFFTIDLVGVSPSEGRAQVTHCFLAASEAELVVVLRSLTLLTVLSICESN